MHSAFHWQQWQGMRMPGCSSSSWHEAPARAEADAEAEAEGLLVAAAEAFAEAGGQRQGQWQLQRQRPPAAGRQGTGVRVLYTSENYLKYFCCQNLGVENVSEILISYNRVFGKSGSYRQILRMFKSGKNCQVVGRSEKLSGLKNYHHCRIIDQSNGQCYDRAYSWELGNGQVRIRI